MNRHCPKSRKLRRARCLGRDARRLVRVDVGNLASNPREELVSNGAKRRSSGATSNNVNLLAMESQGAGGMTSGISAADSDQDQAPHA